MTTIGDYFRNRIKRHSLARQLRRLPVPATPPELKSKLLAAIPEKISVFQPSFSIRQRWGWKLAWSSAAAFILLTILIGTLLTPRSSNSVSLSAEEKSMSPRYVLGNAHNNFKETQPCDILPPFRY